MVRYREGTADDRDGILALRSIVFPGDDVEKQQPAFWEWEFAGGYAGPARYFVAEADARIVGHIAFVPQTYLAPEPVRGALAVDAMTHPNFRRQHIFAALASFAVERVREQCEVLTAFQIRKPVFGGMLAAGYRVADSIPVLLRPLSLLRIGRDLLSASSAPDAQTRESPQCDGVDKLLETLSIRQARTPEFLAWRYARNPFWRYSIDTVCDGERLQAFVVHRDTILRGIRTTAIADAGVLPGQESALRDLLRDVCAESRKRGSGMAAAFLSEHHPAYAALRTNRFFPGPHRFHLLLQHSGRIALDDRPWSLSWGDTDHL